MKASVGGGGWREKKCHIQFAKSTKCLSAPPVRGRSGCTDDDNNLPSCVQNIFQPARIRNGHFSVIESPSMAARTVVDSFSSVRRSALHLAANTSSTNHSIKLFFIVHRFCSLRLCLRCHEFKLIVDALHRSKAKGFSMLVIIRVSILSRAVSNLFQAGALVPRGMQAKRLKRTAANGKKSLGWD